MYEIARKHCGAQKSWKISLSKLHEKTGATMVLKNFRVAINSLALANVLPDYLIEYNRSKDMITLHSRDENVHNQENKKMIASIANNLLSK